VNPAANASSYSRRAMPPLNNPYSAAGVGIDPSANQVVAGITGSPVQGVTSSWTDGGGNVWTEYKWAQWSTGVRTCTIVILTPTPGPTNTPTPTPVLHSISGNVYLRANSSISCNYDGTAPADTALPGMQVREMGTGITDTSQADGSYLLDDVPESPGTRNIQINFNLSDYAIVCRAMAVQCVPNDDTIPPFIGCGTFNVNVSSADWILKSTLNDPWWQTVGGDVGANSNISPNPIVESFLPPGSMLSESVGSLVSGLLTYGSGNLTNIDLNGQPFANPNWIVQSEYDLASKEDYEYFMTLTGAHGSSGWTCSTDPCNRPAYSGTGTDYYIMPNLEIGGNTWTTMVAGNKQVIFVNGNLLISGNVTVPAGAFLAFIVSGNITINPGVNNIQGIYVADGTISTASDTIALTGAGSFIGWTDVDLNRDLGAGNAANPAELFYWRPDLLINAPDEFRSANYHWQEVEP
jgi:hypothetical protein